MYQTLQSFPVSDILVKIKFTPSIIYEIRPSNQPGSRTYDARNVFLVYPLKTTAGHAQIQWLPGSCLEDNKTQINVDTDFYLYLKLT